MTMSSNRKKEGSTCTSTSISPASTNNMKSTKSVLLLLLHWLIHAFCVAVYLLPLFTHGYEGLPVLDEAHIVSKDNRDVSGEAPWYEALYNDYWGRPMNSPSSHKSWRPLTIYTFRLFSAQRSLTLHRCFNVFTHAAVAEILSQLFSNANVLHRICIKLFFALHPTHVEVVVNAANRPHLLACLFALTISDPTLPIQWVALFEVCGLMCAETFIFTMPAVLLTMTFLQRRQEEQRKTTTTTCWYDTMIVLMPRVFVIVMFTLLYIVGRWVLDTLSIPDGLIRPAENPFYEFVGIRRVLSYLYVISIHVAKSMGVDFIGFSHEYGRDCIRPVDSLYDARLLIPFGMILCVVLGVVVVMSRSRRVLRHKQQQQQHDDYWLPFVMHLSWMATLFPISGIIKVGTFVADRIVVASTISTSVLMGAFLSTWLELQHPKRRLWKMACVAVMYLVMWYRLHMRALQWMDSVPLLSSSLTTCPRSAKSHLEMSKVHSGLYPNLFNLTKSLEHIRKVEEIDGDYCDVHQQYAHVYIQQNEYLLFEQHLVKALLCPFTQGGSIDLWHRYWKAVGHTPEAQERMNAYNAVIQRAVLEEQQRNEPQ